MLLSTVLTLIAFKTFEGISHLATISPYRFQKNAFKVECLTGVMAIVFNWVTLLDLKQSWCQVYFIMLLYQIAFLWWILLLELPSIHEAAGQLKCLRKLKHKKCLWLLRMEWAVGAGLIQMGRATYTHKLQQTTLIWRHYVIFWKMAYQWFNFRHTMTTY